MVERELGAVLYLREEGRGIGLFNKLLTKDLQNHGYDTVDANLAIGMPVDRRDYSMAAKILKDVYQPNSIELLTIIQKSSKQFLLASTMSGKCRSLRRRTFTI